MSPLFIDHNVDGRHEYELLKLYLVPGTSVKGKHENAKTLHQAEEIIIAKTENMVDDKAQEEAAKDKSHMLLSDFISILMRILRSIYNRAVEDGLTAQNTPFKRVYTGVDKTSKRALSIKEIKKIKDLDLTNTPTLDFARDMFLFSFYMRGMSFIDIAYLKKKDLSNGFVVYNRRKTGQQMIVKWEKSMEEIANKHPNEYNTFLFPIIISPNVIERKQYLNKMLLVNKYLKKVAKLAEIRIPLTMYVARHSWASIAHSQYIPMKAIILGMGHDNEETTQIYLASIQTNIIDNANSKILNLLNKHK